MNTEKISKTFLTDGLSIAGPLNMKGKFSYLS